MYKAALRTETQFKSLTLGMIPLDKEVVGSDAKPGAAAVGRALVVYKWRQGPLFKLTPAKWEGEVVDLAFYVGAFFRFVKFELLLDAPMHITAVVQRTDLVENLCARGGILFVGPAGAGSETNCTADLVGHELAHLLPSCPKKSLHVEEAFCDVIGCAFEDYIFREGFNLPTPPDFLIGEDRAPKKNSGAHIRDLEASKPGPRMNFLGAHARSMEVSQEFVKNAKKKNSVIDAARAFIDKYRLQVIY